MPAQLTTRAQVNGYRFLLHRFEHALVRRDVRMIHDPMRIQFRSLIMGLVLAILFTGGFLVLAFVHPQGRVGSAKIAMDSDSGALYALVDKTWHPVLNLASARLVAGSAEAPTRIAGSTLASLPRGPLLGIPGAPAALPAASDADRSEWTLCDDVTVGVKTTVLVARPQPAPATTPLGADQALLVSHDGQTYLVYDGKHARIDTGDAAVSAELALNGQRPRQASAGLIDATSAAPDLATPQIPGAGSPGPVHGANLTVGSVIEVDNVDSAAVYVILADGVQKLSPFAAVVLRTASSMGTADIARVPPDALNGVPVVHELALDDFPQRQPTLVASDDNPVACVNWTRGQHDSVARRVVLAGKQVPLPLDSHPVTLVSGGQGRRADIVDVPPATGEFIQVTGIEPDSVRRDGLFYVTDTGVRFGIPDTATAALLGLANPKLAPWQIVDQLPAGPMLDRPSALVARDTVGTG